MSDLQARFETAAEEVKQLPERPDDRTLLKLYGLYKQATVGNVSGKRPPFSDFKERMKYDAWARRRGTSKEKAMQAYIDLAESLKKG